MWLLDAAIRKEMERAIHAGIAPTVEQQTKYVAARFDENGAPVNRILTVSGETAEIEISGTMTQAPSLMAMIFGGGNVTYPEIDAALLAAEGDARVKDHHLLIDSGGGHFAGLFDVIGTLQSLKKPIRVTVSNLCASAAYAIASQAGRITVKNRATRIGSLGVAAEIQLDDSYVSLTSTQSPRKRPDVTTEEGRAVIITELDAMHDLYIEAVAQGRGATIEAVNASYGQGATLLADEALKRGMIDAIAAPALRSVNLFNSPAATKSGQTLENKPMDLATLKAQHPDAYAAAAAEGATNERDRVVGHVTMGEASGDLKTAMASIKDGSTMTATLQATYLAAGMNRTDLSNRAADNAEALAAVAAAEAAAASNEDDGAVKLLEARFGVEGV